MRAKDADLARLRGQRDDLSAELTERRQRENLKLAQMQEIRTLANAKQERISALSSEVRRLKLAFAASRGDSQTVEALKAAGGEGESDLTLLAQLEERLK